MTKTANFPKSRMATAAILDFQFMLIWALRCVDSAVFVFFTKFGLNICYSHCDRCTYAEDLHLMTSRELTSCFKFWSCGHIRMVAMHLPIKFVADIFIRSGVIGIFPKRPPPSWICWGSHGTTHEGTLVVHTSCKNFVMIGSVGFKL